MAERVTQQFVDDQATGEVFKDRLWHMISQTFAFHPVPQAAKPALDIYANRDPFRDRPIEPFWEQQLSPSLRTSPGTTMPAIKASETLEGIFGDDSKAALSPRQIDYLVSGYLGTVGLYATGIADTLWRNAKGEEAPSRRWTESKPIRRFYRDLATPAYSTRYQTLFYDGLQEANRVYSDVKRLEELGRLAEARERAETRRDWLRLRKPLNRAQRELSEISEAMEQIQRSTDMDGDYKRRELERLRAIRNQITKVLGQEVETLRAQED
ncbi:hypothetical protein LWH48_12045 [Halomonas sp. G15]|nr:hypothetical protein [Halomonas sp. G15]